jgi:nucleoside triphosphate diphosphatase
MADGSNDTPNNAAAAIERLLTVMARLRDPAKGCPWDREQSFATIVPYTIEEAYEVADAIASGNLAALKDELGDLLFQVVFYAQMAREDGHFDFADIAQGIADKMERRHPHVFGDAHIETAAAQTVAWEATKARERAAAEQASGKPPSILDGVARALPALTRAEKLTKRAARHGFDWPEAAQVLDKIEEEIGELRAELVPLGSNSDGRQPRAATQPMAVAATMPSKERLADELGDLFFACANLARKLDLDPETTLRAANDKFTRRFHRVEALLAERGKTPGDSTLAEMDALWDQVKMEERQG